MDKLRIFLGLAAGGYWVYLVQTRKLDLKPWEYWAGLGIGAYWAWLAYTTPATMQKVGTQPAQPAQPGQAQTPVGPGATPEEISPPVSTQEHTSYPGIVYPPPDEQDWLEEKGEEEQFRLPPDVGTLPLEEWELPDR